MTPPVLPPVQPGESLLVIGPSGAGKSTLPVTAMAAEGSGVAILAPGSVELASYRKLVGPTYRIESFADPLFLPHIGSRETEGLAKALRFLVDIRKELTATPGKYAIVAVDTGTGIGELATNVMLKRMGIDVPPVARSQEGATYYTGLSSLQQQFYTVLDSLKDLGATIIVCTHASERENVSETAMAGLSGQVILPLVPGGFKNSMASRFDLVLYAGVNKAATLTTDGHNDPAKPRHYLLWAADPKRPTKSKLGTLGANAHLSNEWLHIKPLLEKARG